MIMDIDDFQIDFKKESSKQSIKDILDIPITILNVKVSKSKFFNKENRSKKYLEINYKIKGSQDDLIRKVCTNSEVISNQIIDIFTKVKKKNPPEEFTLDIEFDCVIKNEGAIRKFYILKSAKGK